MNVDQLVVADTGALLSPGLHDGAFLGMLIFPNKKIQFFAKELNGKVHCFVLTGVERFYADDFREGNIILDITVESGGKVVRQDISEIFGSSGSVLAEASISDIMKKFATRDFILVRLNTSYGGWFVCVCTGIEMLKNWTSEMAVLANWE